MSIFRSIAPSFSCLDWFLTLSNSARRALQPLAPIALLALLGAHGARAATCTVTSTADTSTSGTLRYCLNNLASGAAATTNTINITATGTLTLTSALPAINNGVTITGPGANQLTISGAGAYRIFDIGTTGSPAVSITGLTLANGYSANAGGAINDDSGVLMIDACAFSGNSTTTNGGAINANGAVTVTGSTFSGNSSGTDAAGIEAMGTLTVIDSSFSGNTVNADGGAIESFAALTVTGGTFSGNSAGGYGGALNLAGGAGKVNNSIFAGNTAATSGGAIQGGVNASYNVFYNNVVKGGEVDCSSCSANTNAVSGNPMLLPLGWYGGPTETMLPRPGSAAICAANSADAVNASNNPLTADQRGFPLSAANCANSGVDAGAVQTDYLTVTTLKDGANAGTTCTGGATCSLRDAIGLANTATSSNHGGDDIDFEPSLTSAGSPGTIALANALPAITGAVNIVGPGANQLAVSGGKSSTVGSVFTIDSSATAALYGLAVEDGYVSNNTGSANGGGIRNAGTLTVTAGAISGNTASSPGSSNGSGIYNVGTLAITGSTISGNTVSTVAGASYGGGIYNSGTLSVTASTISGDAATSSDYSYGAGIYNTGTLTVTGSTISGNTADSTGFSSGGGIYSTGKLTLANSIAAGNKLMGNGGYADINGSYTDAGGNLADRISSATSPIDPSLSPLQYNGAGAAVQTMIPLPGSPALCAGKTSNIPSGTTTDERGFPLTTSSYCSPGQIDAGAVQTNYTAIAFVQQPSNTVVSTAITPAPAVAVIETNSSTSTTDAVAGVPVTLDYSGGVSELSGGAGSLTATTACTTINSQTVNAAAYNLTPTTVGTGFTLSVGANGGGIPVGSKTLSQTSSSFDVFPVVAATAAISAISFPVFSQASFIPVTGSGGAAPLTYSVSPALPADLSMNSATGAITGAATVTSAAANYTVTVKDADNMTAQAVFSMAVIKAVTSTTLSVSSTTIGPGQGVTLSAQVSSPLSGTPTGSVNFYSDGVLLGTEALNAGTATYSIKSLSMGTVAKMTATYLGNSDFDPSTAAAGATVTVTDFSLTATPPSEEGYPGDLLFYSITAAPLLGSNYPGAVNFTVTGLPPGAYAFFSSVSIPANGGKQTVRMTIHLKRPTGIFAMLRRDPPLSDGRRLPPLALAFLLLFGVGALRRRGKMLRGWLGVLLLMGTGLAAIAGLSGCFGYVYSPTPYTVTVTASSANVQHSVTVTVIQD